MDGAAVLLHSIRRNSYGWTDFKEQMETNNGEAGDGEKWPKYGGRGGRYRYRAYAFVDAATSPDHPSSNANCARFLQKLGYGEKDDICMQILQLLQWCR